MTVRRSEVSDAYMPGHHVTLGCGCRAALEVRLPAQPLCAMRIVVARCGAHAHRAGRRIITSLSPVS